MTAAVVILLVTAIVAIAIAVSHLVVSGPGEGMLWSYWVLTTVTGIVLVAPVPGLRSGRNSARVGAMLAYGLAIPLSCCYGGYLFLMGDSGTLIPGRAEYLAFLSVSFIVSGLTVIVLLADPASRSWFRRDWKYDQS